MKNFVIGSVIFIVAFSAQAFATKTSDKAKLETSIRINCAEGHELSVQRPDEKAVVFSNEQSVTDVAYLLFEINDNAPAGRYSISIRRPSGGVMDENWCSVRVYRDEFSAIKAFKVKVSESAPAVVYIDFEASKDETEMLKISGDGVHVLYESYGHDETLSKKERLKKYKDYLKDYSKWDKAMKAKIHRAKEKSSK